MDHDACTAIEPTTELLVVADWTIAPEAVVSTLRQHDIAGPSALHVVVPAWLHGLDWAGDPWASIPCAQRQLEGITTLCAESGLHVRSAAVGDPDPLSAISDAIADWDVEAILLFARGRHVAAGYPLSVARRAQRLTGLRVQSYASPLASEPRRRRFHAGGHCEPATQPRFV